MPTTDRHEPNGQYRRPRAHFPVSKPLPSVQPRSLLTGSAMLLCLALLMALAMIPLRAGEPETAPTLRDSGKALTPDCTVTQQMTYAPCGHRMTRRIPLPQELTGKTLSDLTAAYDGWQVTAYAPEAVAMERTFPVHCPQHVVLQPDDAGMLCVWQNRYGDALSLVKSLDIPINELPGSLQDEVRRGKGFDAPEALEKWLEAAES